MNNNVYLVYVGPENKIQDNQDFSQFYNGLQHKQQIAPGLYLGYSNVTPKDAFQRFGDALQSGTTSNGTTSIGTAVGDCWILPIDMSSLTQVTNLPSYLKNFVSFQTKAQAA